MPPPTRPPPRINGARGPPNQRPNPQRPQPNAPTLPAHTRPGAQKPPRGRGKGKDPAHSLDGHGNAPVKNVHSVDPRFRGKTIGHYMLGKSIGEGTFGKVKAGTHIITGEKVAIKILEKSRIIEVADVKRVTREIKILKRNRHRNIIQLYDVLDTPTTIYLIMENADGGEMFDYIVSHQRVTEDLACMFFHQLVDGAEYLHQMEVTHRDLKPENLLLQSSADGWIIKIVDFGLSNTHEQDRLLQTACGSPCYAAPEMIAGNAYKGPLADIWSMGVILFALVCGYLPFEHSNTSVLYKKILAGDFKCPDFVSPEVKDLIRRILITDPENRATIASIRRHPWYTQCTMPVTLPNSEPAKMVFDNEIMQQLAALKIDTASVGESLRQGVCNHLTASYYLQLNRKKRNKEKKELREKMYNGQDLKPKTVEELTQEALTINKTQQPAVEDLYMGNLSVSGGVAATAPSFIQSENSNTVGVGSFPIRSTVSSIAAVTGIQPGQPIPKLQLNGIQSNAPSNAVKDQLPDLITNKGGKPAKTGVATRAQARQEALPTGSQTDRGKQQQHGYTYNPTVQAPATARPAVHDSPAADPPAGALPDGAPVVNTNPWGGNNGERPNTRSGTRSGERNKPVRAISGGLGEVQKPKAMKEADGANKPQAPSGARPSGGGGGGRGGGQVKDANRSKEVQTVAQPAALPSAVAIPPTHPGHVKPDSHKRPELTSQPSARPQKALYNDLKKACKSRNIGCKMQTGLQFLCETALSNEKDPVIFTLEVEKFGDVKGMHILKSVLVGGNEDDMRKVCKVIFNAVGKG